MGQGAQEYAIVLCQFQSFIPPPPPYIYNGKINNMSNIIWFGQVSNIKVKTVNIRVAKQRKMR